MQFTNIINHFVLHLSCILWLYSKFLDKNLLNAIDPIIDLLELFQITAKNNLLFMIYQQNLFFFIKFVLFDLLESYHFSFTLLPCGTIKIPILKLTLLHSFVLSDNVNLSIVLGNSMSP